MTSTECSIEVPLAANSVSSFFVIETKSGSICGRFIDEKDIADKKTTKKAVKWVDQVYTGTPFGPVTGILLLKTKQE